MSRFLNILQFRIKWGMRHGVMLVLAGFFFDTLQAQDVSLVKLDQLNRRLSQGGDTTFVVNFWATWCAPCLKELPYFQELQDKYSHKPLKVILVSLDAKNALNSKVRPLIGRERISTEVFLLDETDQQVYIDRISPTWSGALPATLFVNRKKDKRVFYEKEFTFSALESAYKEVLE